MSEIGLPESEASARIELRALGSYIWGGRKIILWTAVVFSLLGLLWYRTAQPIYEASATLSAAPGSSTNASNGSPLSGAARLIGLGGAGGAGAEYVKFQSLLTSATLADRMAATNGLLQRMYPTQWDEKTHSWKQPSGFFTTVKNAIRDALGMKPSHPPNAQSVFVLLQDDLTQNLSLQTNLLELTFTDPDPENATMFLTVAHREADNILRDAARERSRRRIDYLQHTLLMVNAVDLRQSLIQLLNQEEQTNMMIESDPNYSADMVDPPHAPPIPISPKLTVAVFVSIMLGLVFGLVLYIVLRSLNLYPMRFRLASKRLRTA